MEKHSTFNSRGDKFLGNLLQKIAGPGLLSKPAPYNIPWLQKDYWRQWKKFSKLKPVYYTSLFQNVGIGEYYLRKCLGLIGAVGNEIIKKRAQ